MTNKERASDSAPSRETTQVSDRTTTIPAKDVGVSLAISEHALEEINRIQEETIRAAQAVQKFAWR